MARKGVVQITVGGKITHDRRERPKQPGQWNVTLAGSHAAPLELVLDMDQQTEGGIVGPAEVLKAAGFQVKPLCKSPFISSGTNLYVVKAAGYRPVVLAHHWSSGSAGNWESVTLAYTNQRAAKQQCE